MSSKGISQIFLPKPYLITGRLALHNYQTWGTELTIDVKDEHGHTHDLQRSVQMLPNGRERCLTYEMMIVRSSHPQPPPRLKLLAEIRMVKKKVARMSGAKVDPSMRGGPWRGLMLHDSSVNRCVTVYG